MIPTNHLRWAKRKIPNAYIGHIPGGPQATETVLQQLWISDDAIFSRFEQLERITDFLKDPADDLEHYWQGEWRDVPTEEA